MSDKQSFRYVYHNLNSLYYFAIHSVSRLTCFTWFVIFLLLFYHIALQVLQGEHWTRVFPGMLLPRSLVRWLALWSIKLTYEEYVSIWKKILGFVSLVNASRCVPEAFMLSSLFSQVRRKMGLQNFLVVVHSFRLDLFVDGGICSPSGI